MNVKLAASLAAAAVLAGGGTTAAWAATGSTTPAAAGTAAASASAPALPCASTALATLVSNGTITEAQATAIQNAMQAYMRGHLGDMRGYMSGRASATWSGGPMATVLRQLVSQGMITSAQVAAITGQMRAYGAGASGTPAGMMGGGHMGWPAAGSSPS
jgi:competence protein ComGC